MFRFLMSLYLLLHLDIVVFGRQEYWWYWSFFSIGVNTVDFFMVVTLVFGKDWLGLSKLFQPKTRQKNVSY